MRITLKCLDRMEWFPAARRGRDYEGLPGTRWDYRFRLGDCRKSLRVAVVAASPAVVGLAAGLLVRLCALFRLRMLCLWARRTGPRAKHVGL